MFFLNETIIKKIIAFSYQSSDWRFNSYVYDANVLLSYTIYSWYFWNIALNQYNSCRVYISICKFIIYKGSTINETKTYAKNFNNFFDGIISIFDIQLLIMGSNCCLRIHETCRYGNYDCFGCLYSLIICFKLKGSRN